MVMATAVPLIMDMIHIVTEDFMATIMVMVIRAIMGDMDLVILVIIVVTTEVGFMAVIMVLVIIDSLEVAITEAFTPAQVYEIIQHLMEEMKGQAIFHPNGTTALVVLPVLPEEETHTYQDQHQELAADLVHRLLLPIKEEPLQKVVLHNRPSVAAELFRTSQIPGQVLFREHLPI